MQINENRLKPAKPFTALLVEYNKHNERVKKRTRITLSQYGIRSENLPQDSNKAKLIYIQNYKSSQEWLVNSQRQYYSEIPNGSPVISDEGYQGDGADDGKDDTMAWSGVLRSLPCSGAKGKKINTRSVRNSELSVWKCNDAQGRDYLQHYSSLLGYVIRQETSDGQIGELKEIKFIDKPNDYFRPSEMWREVSMEELLTGAPMLPAYKE
ncbi:MAG: hypothetical protein ABW092_09970 [Candidatus Thiodiazotropha sp.]